MIKKTFLFLTFLNIFCFSEIKNCNYIYEEKIGNRNFTSNWTLKKKGSNISVKGDQLFSAIDVLYTPFFVTKKYFFKNQKKDIEFTIYQKNNYLFIKGVKNKKPISKKYKLRDPWIQQFSFGLYPFFLSKKKKIKFCLISPKDFSMHKMVAVKKGKKTIQINGKSYKTQIVHISLPGIKSLFWKAKLWFLENGDLLKYSSNSGPKTPEIISFLKEKNYIE